MHAGVAVARRAPWLELPSLRFVVIGGLATFFAATGEPQRLSGLVEVLRGQRTHDTVCARLARGGQVYSATIGLQMGLFLSMQHSSQVFWTAKSSTEASRIVHLMQH